MGGRNDDELDDLTKLMICPLLCLLVPLTLPYFGLDVREPQSNYGESRLDGDRGGVLLVGGKRDYV